MKTTYALSLLLSFSLFSSLCAHRIEQDGIIVNVNDLSVNDKQKVIGSHDSKVQVKELNFLNIYPVSMEITNNRKHTVSLSPNGFSLIPHNLAYMKRWTPTNNLFETILGGAGGALSVVGLLRTLAGSKKGKFFMGVGAIPLVYAVYKKYVKSSDHAVWFSQNMLSDTVLINPGESLKKYVFFKQDIYDGNNVYMTLGHGVSDHIKIEIVSGT